MKKPVKILLIILCCLVVLAAAVFTAMKLSAAHRSSPSDVRHYETDNPFVVDRTYISAHRSGGGIAPESTMMAFKNCVESSGFSVETFEFDLHITKDGVLVLLHDDDLDRTSDSEYVFGRPGVRPSEMTFEELRQLNMGADYTDKNGEKPYASLHGDDVPEDLRILSLRQALEYLSSNGDYTYIIEIKDGGDDGRKGVDILWDTLLDLGLERKAVFGTFHKEVSAYVDETYPDMLRSTSIPEVIAFWWAAITGSRSYEPPCRVLQIPFTDDYLKYGINLATATVINYAHSHGMAVQYWTINDPGDMEYLLSMGADCIMTDHPDVLYALMNGRSSQ